MSHHLVGHLDGLSEVAGLALAPAEVEEQVDAQLLEGAPVPAGVGRHPAERVLVPVRGLRQTLLLEQGVAVLEELVQQKQPGGNKKGRFTYRPFFPKGTTIFPTKPPYFLWEIWPN